MRIHQSSQPTSLRCNITFNIPNTRIKLGYNQDIIILYFVTGLHVFYKRLCVSYDIYK
jgi:hypothetical protein